MEYLRLIPTVDDIESWLDAALPHFYRQFLNDHADELIASELVLLYGRSSFIERKDTYETRQYCPGFVTIGNDSGDMELILSLTDGSVSMVDGGTMRAEDAERVADDLRTWIENDCHLPIAEATAFPATEHVIVYLENIPSSLKTLLLIKQHLGIDTPLGELKTLIDTVPCSLTSDLTYMQAIKRCAKVNVIDDCLGIRMRSDNAIRLPLDWQG
ncbi:SMI1/KNR4 family protein [Stieleria sp. JC731]|uniref:SMI1/KNR4 family protein n=1 Tax=Stieleria sp. JC731 TaxID=2894195 RepID=UPI001E4F7C32|nr:SMI1/KNR4 family protein [Stieleria sp. JC731]MCC9603363.1 SMI1/KNR4 family protein [Stieleria sp. JC731]